MHCSHVQCSPIGPVGPVGLNLIRLLCIQLTISFLTVYSSTTKKLASVRQWLLLKITLPADYRLVKQRFVIIILRSHDTS